jgi:hypothetical protein
VRPVPAQFRHRPEPFQPALLGGRGGIRRQTVYVSDEVRHLSPVEDRVAITVDVVHQLEGRTSLRQKSVEVSGSVERSASRVNQVPELLPVLASEFDPDTHVTTLSESRCQCCNGTFRVSRRLR